MDALRIISEDHNNLWRLATTVDQLATDMEAGAPLEQAFFTSVLDYIEQFVERSHHPKEDDFLFPMLRLRNPYAAETLDGLQEDHRAGLGRLTALRESLAAAATGSLPVAELANRLRAYTAGMKKHILVEEKQVIPLARKALLKEDWVDINRAFLDNGDPLFGESAQAEFRELYHRIVSTAPESVGLGAHSAGDLPPKVAVAQAEVLLRVQGMESCYGRIKAIKSISLEVRRGETVALVGANGAGKTTFLRTLSGVQPMSAGNIFFDGEDISGLRSDKRMRRGICQSPEGRQGFD